MTKKTHFPNTIINLEHNIIAKIIPNTKDWNEFIEKQEERLRGKR